MKNKIKKKINSIKSINSTVKCTKKNREIYFNYIIDLSHKNNDNNNNTNNKSNGNRLSDANYNIQYNNNNNYQTNNI